MSVFKRGLDWLRWRMERTSPIVVGLSMVGFAIAIHIPTLDQPLVETQGFRQTTTAFPALIFHEQGIDLLRPQVPVFGSPFALPIEFPLFQAAASIVMGLGIPPDAALRVTALASFVVTALLVWRLLVAIAGDAAGLAGLVAFAFSPLGLLVSRMSLIEYMATGGALAFVLWGLRWHETGRWRWYIAGLTAGIVGFLVKPPPASCTSCPSWCSRSSAGGATTGLSAGDPCTGWPPLDCWLSRSCWLPSGRCMPTA